MSSYYRLPLGADPPAPSPPSTEPIHESPVVPPVPTSTARPAPTSTAKPAEKHKPRAHYPAPPPGPPPVDARSSTTKDAKAEKVRIEAQPAAKPGGKIALVVLAAAVLGTGAYMWFTRDPSRRS